jgi:hypothetical protein
MKRVSLGGMGLALVLGLAILAGCGETTSSSNPTATSAPATVTSTAVASQRCQLLATVNQALTQVSQIGNSTTVAEVRTFQQKLANALTTLASLPGERGAIYDSLQSFSNQLAAAIQGQPDTATVAQVGPALQNLQGQVAQIQASLKQFASSLNCQL